MRHVLAAALALALTGCAVFGQPDTKAGRLQLVQSADTALAVAQGLTETAAANRWISPETADTAREVLAAARVTVGHAREALASPACAEAAGEAIDTACGITLALEALGAAQDVLALVQPPAAAATAAPPNA